MTDALYDCLVNDMGPNAVKARHECDITYLYAEHRKNNKHTPSNGWGRCSKGIQQCHIKVGDDIERIRLARNQLAHSEKFALSDKDYYSLYNQLECVLRRFEVHNNVAVYQAKLSKIKKKDTGITDVDKYREKIRAG